MKIIVASVKSILRHELGWAEAREYVEEAT